MMANSPQTLCSSLLGSDKTAVLEKSYSRVRGNRTMRAREFRRAVLKIFSVCLTPALGLDEENVMSESNMGSEVNANAVCCVEEAEEVDDKEEETKPPATRARPLPLVLASMPEQALFAPPPPHRPLPRPRPVVACGEEAERASVSTMGDEQSGPPDSSPTRRPWLFPGKGVGE